MCSFPFRASCWWEIRNETDSSIGRQIEGSHYRIIKLVSFQVGWLLPSLQTKAWQLKAIFFSPPVGPLLNKFKASSGHFYTTVVDQTAILSSNWSSLSRGRMTSPREEPGFAGSQASIPVLQRVFFFKCLLRDIVSSAPIHAFLHLIILSAPAWYSRVPWCSYRARLFLLFVLYLVEKTNFIRSLDSKLACKT